MERLQRQISRQPCSSYTCHISSSSLTTKMESFDHLSSPIVSADPVLYSLYHTHLFSAFQFPNNILCLLKSTVCDELAFIYSRSQSNQRQVSSLISLRDNACPFKPLFFLLDGGLQYPTTHFSHCGDMNLTFSSFPTFR